LIYSHWNFIATEAQKHGNIQSPILCFCASVAISFFAEGKNCFPTNLIFLRTFLLPQKHGGTEKYRAQFCASVLPWQYPFAEGKKSFLDKLIYSPWEIFIAAETRRHGKYRAHSVLPCFRGNKILLKAKPGGME
jgi:hypothetical protein